MPNFETSPAYLEFCEERLQDPYPLFAQMRSEDPVHWNDRMKLWLLTRYDDVAATLRDKRLSASRQNIYRQALPDELAHQVRPLLDHLQNWLLMIDPPEHTRLRRIVNAAFTPRLIENLRPRIREIADSLLTDLPADEPFDFIERFTYPLSATVICEMLGVPSENQSAFRVTNDRLFNFSSRGGPKLAEHALSANEALLSLHDVFNEIAEARRKAPREDLISALVQAKVVGEELSNELVLAFCTFLFLAGHEATTSSIATGLMLLLRHPEQFQRLRADPERLVSTFREEVLRYESAAFRGVRQASVDFELRGKLIRKGQPVVMLLGAANRDPEQFPDPDRFDIARSPNQHLAFGSGPHICLGAPLARIEMDIAFTAICSKLPAIELATEELPWRPLMGARSLQKLPVRLK